MVLGPLSLAVTRADGGHKFAFQRGARGSTLSLGASRQRRVKSSLFDAGPWFGKALEIGTENAAIKASRAFVRIRALVGENEIAADRMFSVGSCALTC